MAKKYTIWFNIETDMDFHFNEKPVCEKVYSSEKKAFEAIQEYIIHALNTLSVNHSSSYSPTEYRDGTPNRHKEISDHFCTMYRYAGNKVLHCYKPAGNWHFEYKVEVE